MCWILQHLNVKMRTQTWNQHEYVCLYRAFSCDVIAAILKGKNNTFSLPWEIRSTFMPNCFIFLALRHGRCENPVLITSCLCFHYKVGVPKKSAKFFELHDLDRYSLKGNLLVPPLCTPGLKSFLQRLEKLRGFSEVTGLPFLVTCHAVSMRSSFTDFQGCA